jgi:hypothetical protein
VKIDLQPKDQQPAALLFDKKGYYFYIKNLPYEYGQYKVTIESLNDDPVLDEFFNAWIHIGLIFSKIILSRHTSDCLYVSYMATRLNYTSLSKAMCSNRFPTNLSLPLAEITQAPEREPERFDKRE